MPNNESEPVPASGEPNTTHVQPAGSDLPDEAPAPAPEGRVAVYLDALKKLIKDSGVKQIIWVDDDFATDRADRAPEDYFGVVEDADCKVLPGLSDVPSGLPPEARLDRLKAAWRGLTDEGRRSLFEKLHELAISRGVEPALHFKIAGHFGQVPECDVKTMALSQWREAQSGWIASKFEGKFTLLLVDQDFRKEGGSAEGGTEILRNLQEAIPDPEADKLRCALLTQPLIREEHQAWDKFAIDKGLKRSRFMLISKQRLTEDQLGGFLMMLRLALLNPLCESLRGEAEGVYQAALEEAKKHIAGITIYDVEQIVFASSRREGVWEPDTLFRILGMYLRREARKLAVSNDRLRTIADTVRSIAGASTLDPSPKQEGTKALEIRQIELYEDAAYLNKHFTPIDLGDLFEVQTAPDAAPKQYILLAQPCDMMVRHDDPKGERKHSVTEGTLLEVFTDDPPVEGQPPPPKVKYDPLLMYRLDYYRSNGEHAYVDFSKARGVNFAILDLCAMREDGSAELEAFDRTTKQKFIPSWQSHNDNIRKKLREACESWHLMSQACLGVQAQKDKINRAIRDAAFADLFGPSLWIHFQPTRISNKGNIRIAFQCKRIRRLNQPWAGAMLTAYSQYLSRAAFEHDYGSIGFDVGNVQVVEARNAG